MITEQPFRRALVVDDDLQTRVLIRSLLQNSGFEVLEAPSGQIALELLSRTGVDVVLLDILMPGLDGFQTCTAIRATPELRSTPIIMVTSQDDEGSIQRSYDAGATDFVTKPLNYTLLAHRVSYVVRANRHLALLDHQTGFPNRKMLDEHLERAIGSAQRNGQRIAMMLVEMGGAKRVSSALGRGAADAAIQAFGERLNGALLEQDSPQSCYQAGPLCSWERTIARVGEAEFAIILNELPQQTFVLRTAGEIRHKLETPVLVHGHELQLKASIGISFFPEDASSADGLWQCAETALLQAKHKGRSAIQTFKTVAAPGRRNPFTLESALRKAIEHNEIELCYQPKLNLHSSGICGLEALARWPSSLLGTVAPEEFIPIAEQSGLIRSLGRRVLQRACNDAAALHKAGFEDLTMAVNLSPAQLDDPDLPDLVEDALRSTGLAASHLELEVTETLFVDHGAATRANIVALKELGVRLLIDDFGTGYSSLAYLSRLDVDGLKIDRAFVKELPHQTNGAAVVNAVVALARSLGLRVVAEGVETAEQLVSLRAFRCDEVQGFLISRPLAFEPLLTWLSAHEHPSMPMHTLPQALRPRLVSSLPAA